MYSHHTQWLDVQDPLDVNFYQWMLIFYHLRQYQLCHFTGAQADSNGYCQTRPAAVDQNS
jgi:hypothetical protein